MILEQVSPHSLNLSLSRGHINKNNSKRMENDYFDINKFS